MLNQITKVERARREARHPDRADVAAKWLVDTLDVRHDVRTNHARSRLYWNALGLASLMGVSESFSEKFDRFGVDAFVEGVSLGESELEAVEVWRWPLDRSARGFRGVNEAVRIVLTPFDSLIQAYDIDGMSVELRQAGVYSEATLFQATTRLVRRAIVAQATDLAAAQP
jgi:hypothetical protein